AKLDNLKAIMNSEGNIHYLSSRVNNDKGKIFGGDNLRIITATILQIPTPSATVTTSPTPSIIVISPAERTSAVVNYLTNYIPIVEGQDTTDVKDAFINTRQEVVKWLCEIADGLDLTIDVGLSFSQASRSVYESLTQQTLEDYDCGIFSSSSPELPTISAPFVVPVPSAANGISILDADEVKNLTRFITYSAAAYCSDMLDDWNCGVYCDNIPGTVFMKTIQAKGLDIIFQTFAFISVNKDNREIVITFHGSINPFNIFQVIFRAELVQYGTDPLIKVHKGFLASFNSLKDEIRSEITNLIELYKGYEIIVTGHSLGE
ncbi:5836_t:CDS:2, partial [Cetraspora pellucida]